MWMINSLKFQRKVSVSENNLFAINVVLAFHVDYKLVPNFFHCWIFTLKVFFHSSRSTIFPHKCWFCRVLEELQFIQFSWSFPSLILILSLRLSKTYKYERSLMFITSVDLVKCAPYFRYNIRRRNWSLCSYYSNKFSGDLYGTQLWLDKSLLLLSFIKFNSTTWWW